VTAALWPYTTPVPLEEARAPEAIDEDLERTMNATVAFTQRLEEFVDAVEHDQADLCRRLWPFHPMLTVAPGGDEQKTLRAIPGENGRWTIGPATGDWGSSSSLARLAIRRAVPDWADIAEARRLEAELLEGARAALEEARKLVEFGGTCFNSDCPRFEYRGQGEVCDTCEQRTLTADGLLDFAKAREAIS
jgi:hypothetical protein